MRSLRAMFVLALLLTCACSSEEKTKIVVAIWSDLPVPSQLDGIRIDVAGREASTRTAALAKAAWPFEVDLMAEGADDAELTVKVTALLENREIVSQSAQVSFVPDRALLLKMTLDEACVGVTCPGAYTCADGVCNRPLVIAKLPPYDPSAPLDRPDAAPVLGGIDSAIGLDVGAGYPNPMDATFDGKPQDRVSVTLDAAQPEARVESPEDAPTRVLLDVAGTSPELGTGGSVGIGGTTGSGGAAGAGSGGVYLSSGGATGSGGISGPDASDPDVATADAPMPDLRVPDAEGTCGTDLDCPASAPLCLVGVCARCTGLNDCATNASGHLCDTSTGRCVACLGDGQCTDPSAPICAAGKCTACQYATLPGGCCVAADCTSGGPNTVGVCGKTTANTCAYECDSQSKSCGTGPPCIAKDKCCTNSECNSGASGTVGTCDASTHQCAYSCDTSTHKGCRGACILKANCCEDVDCEPGYACGTGGSCAPLPGCTGTPLLGCACTSPGALACNGPHQALKLRCVAGLWSDSGTCPSGQNCGQSDGQCHDIITECLASSQYCSDSNTLQTCNDDRTAVTPTPCEGVCSTNACQPPICGDKKTQGARGEECDDGNTATADGCEPDCKASKVVEISAGAGFTCALLSSGEARCWGDNSSAQLGLGSTTQYYTSQPYTLGPVNFGTKATAISSGFNHTCVLLSDGSVRCWGANSSGQHGQGDATARTSVAPAISFSAPVVKLVAGGDTTCAVLQNGEARCWGYNGVGMLGLATTGTPSKTTPATALGPIAIGGSAAAITVQSDAVCASLQSGTVICWGSNGSGQLGRGDIMAIGGSQTPAAAPPPAMPVLPSGRTPITMASGTGHTCVLLDTGYLQCWGSNSAGQLGLGLPASGSSAAIGDDESPSTAGGVQLANVASISARGNSSCAGLVTGGLRCWGLNSKGQLGYGDTTSRGGDNASKPSVLPDISFGSGVSARQVAMGTAHTCALLSNGQVKCWGRDNLGQLGDATVLSGTIDYVAKTPDQLSAVQVFPP